MSVCMLTGLKKGVEDFPCFVFNFVLLVVVRISAWITSLLLRDIECVESKDWTQRLWSYPQVKITLNVFEFFFCLFVCLRSPY